MPRVTSSAWIGPVWWYPMEKMYDTNNCPSDFELQNMKEKLLDNDLKALDTEHNALKTEFDSVKSLIGDNVEKSFNLFS